MTTALDDARGLVAGEGRYERDSSFEPLLVPLVAPYIGAGDVAHACYVGSLSARPNPRVGWPLLGIAVAQPVASFITTDNAWDTVQTLPDLTLYLSSELLDQISVRPAHERINRRIDLRRGVRPFLDVGRAATQPWDAAALALHFEHSDALARQADAGVVLAVANEGDRTRQLLFGALLAPYAAVPSAAAAQALRLLDTDVPPWYWCTIAAHVGPCTRAELPWLMSNGRIASPWAEHYDRLLMMPQGLSPLALPAAAHPFGHELVELLAEMPAADSRALAREVLDGVVDRWAIDVTLDRIPVVVDDSTAVSEEPPTQAPPVRIDVSARGVEGMARVPVCKSFVRGADHLVLVSVDALEAEADTDRTAATITLVHDDDVSIRYAARRRDMSYPTGAVPFSLFVRPDERYVVATLTVSRGGDVVHRIALMGPTGSSPDEIADGVIAVTFR